MTDDRDRFFQLWDPKTGQKLRQIDSGLEKTRYFAFSPDGKMIAAIGSREDSPQDDNVHYLTLTTVATGQLVRQAQWRGAGRLRRIFFAPDGRTLATADGSGSFRLWNADTMALIHFEGPGESSDFSIAYSPDSSSHLLGIARARFIRLWDTERLQDVRTIKIDDEYRCSEITFSRDGVTVLADIRAERTTRASSGSGRLATGLDSSASQA